MKAPSLVARSLRFYWRTHLGVAAGAAVAVAVLVGALVVGDCVRGSLKAMALARLGRTDLALATEDRFFRAKLAEELAPALGAVAPVLQLRGIAASHDGSARINGIQVLGVDKRFWALGGARELLEAGPAEQVVLNERLARKLRARPGETILLRVDTPGIMPRDAPLSTDADAGVTFRLTVKAVATDVSFGRFSLRANQIPPYNAFVPLDWLQEKLGRPGRANVLLVGGDANGSGDPRVADAAFRKHWRLADADLELRELPGRGVLELRSGRVFLDEPATEAALAAGPGGLKILTYFVNELRVGQRATPYSIVSALGGAAGDSTSAGKLLPPDMSDKEILINAWLADDLQAKPGDSVHLTYFVIGPMRRLDERTSRFRVRAVVPLAGAAADRELMPGFPGLADVHNCRDWEPGVPIRLDRIRKKDEDYWDRHRGTPKAFVTLRAGQAMWANRFGSLTALRWPLAKYSTDQLARAILRRFDPASIGLFFQPVRRQALAASTQALDFGRLFLGLSFFLIVAAVLLMGLLFVFGIEQRSQEIGTLLALGFSPRRVRGLLLLEGGLLALIGTAVGAAAGVLYTRCVLYGLSTLWRPALANSSVEFHVEPLSLVIGAGAGLLVAVAAMWLMLLRQARRPARELLAGAGVESALPAVLPGRRRRGLWIALICGIAAACVLAFAGAGRGEKAAGAFFAAGGLLLTAGLALSLFALSKLARTSRTARLTLGGLGLRNSSRRRFRSLAVVALLACGSFLVVAVGANRRDSLSGTERRPSGTGGFAFFGESALPVFRDLNSAAGREAFALAAADLDGVRIVPLRVREGDDASCLNLNRAQRPRLLGVRPSELQSRGAFTFVKTIHGASASSWTLLNLPADDNRGPGSRPSQSGGLTVPAIGDAATITWALGKSVGDVLPYVDERGRTFHLRIVGSIASSILQGGLLISEDNFQRLFPSAGGYRAFLVDCPADRAGPVKKELTRALQEVGLDLTPAAERLAAFNAVENAYLSIFQALGGLGLLLGSAGLGIVVLRNVMERRGELALLRALGFSRRSLHWLVLCEHWALLLLGLTCGVISALVAVLPALRSPGAEVPYASLILTLLAVAASGALWTWLATLAAVRGPLLPALRNE